MCLLYDENADRDSSVRDFMREGGVSDFSHRALLYASPGEFIATAGPYVREGAEAGDSVIAVTTEANIRALREELGDLAEAVDFGSSEDWYGRSPWRTLGLYKRWLSGVPQGAQVRVLGEQMWLARSEAEQREWQRYEAFANITFRAPRTKVVCTYDATQLPEPIFEHVYDTHPEVLYSDMLTESKTFTDPATFAAALDSAPLEPWNGPAVEAELEDLRDLRILLVGEASRTELDTERTADLAVAVNEVATNALKHGGGRGRVRIWTETAQVICEVSDSGPGFSDPFIGHVPPANRDTPGWGLWTSRQLCDLVQLRSGDDGTVVRLHMSVA